MIDYFCDDFGYKAWRFCTEKYWCLPLWSKSTAIIQEITLKLQSVLLWQLQTQLQLTAVRSTDEWLPNASKNGSTVICLLLITPKSELHVAGGDMGLIPLSKIRQTRESTSVTPILLCATIKLSTIWGLSNNNGLESTHLRYTSDIQHCK
jgi:hypothetical protein